MAHLTGAREKSECIGPITGLPRSHPPLLPQFLEGAQRLAITEASHVFSPYFSL